MPPWEKYQSAPAEGPWSKYETPDHISPELQAKMNMAGAKPAQSFPEYAAQTAGQMVIPAMTTAAGGALGNIPGAMAGSALGETINQAAGIGTPKSVFPELNKPDLFKVGIAALAPAVVPSIAKAFSTVKAAVEPFYKSGQEQIIGRALGTAAGGKADEAMQAMSHAKELVPGSMPTAGQASQNAGIASLERAAQAISPESTVAFQGREAAQNIARQAALGTVAKDENAMAAAIAARKAATAGPLQQLSQSTAAVDPSRTVSLIDNLIEKSPGRSQLTNALRNVRETLFKDDGTLRSNASQLYQGARKNITDLLSAKAGDGSKLNEAISRELTVVMKSLDHQIKTAEPSYGQFMQTFAEKSKPINQMQIGQEIEKKATNAVGQVNLNPLAAALSDKTAQRATGFKRATMEGTMSPEQMQTLQAVKDDLVRMVQSRNMAGAAGSDTVKKLAYSNLIDRAGVPTFLREFAPTQAAGNVVARGLDSLYGRQNKEIAERLAATLLSPPQSAQAMQAALPPRYQAMIEALMQAQAPASAALATQQRSQ